MTPEIIAAHLIRNNAHNADRALRSAEVSLRRARREETRQFWREVLAWVAAYSLN